MSGRKTGHNQPAIDWLTARYSALGLEPWKGFYRHEFVLPGGTKKGANIIGLITGKSESLWVVTAHFDHIGAKGVNIYNGANDNASGVAAMLYLAAYWLTCQPNHSMLLVATDAEELGLHGAKALVSSLLAEGEPLAFNINLDMLAARSRGRALYVLTSQRDNPREAGMFDLKLPLPLKRLPVYSRSAARGGFSALRVDYRRASDHSAFRAAKIPYLFFTTGEDRNYHSVRDETENLNADFFEKVVSALLKVTIYLDKHS